MQWFADGRNKRTLLVLLVLYIGTSLTTNILISHKAGAQVTGGETSVGAVICAPESQITLLQPVSDSVVTEAAITLEGTVKQASQIEITIDNTFDSIIQLNLGQTNFTGTVQLTTGTHTITVKAVNICPGVSGEATTVITYTPPPQTPSSGTNTDTIIGGVSESSSTDGGGAPVDESPMQHGLIGEMLTTLEGVAQWLNIDIAGLQERDGLSVLTIQRAIVLTAGLSLAIMGLSPAIIQTVASAPVLSTVLHASTMGTGRVRFLSRGARLVGVILVTAALFL